jgi:RimJ/RimL family protein N-acetyltransferase
LGKGTSGVIAPFVLEGAAIRLTPLKIEHVEELCAIGLEPSLWRSTTIEVRSRADMDSYVRMALDAQSKGAAVPFVIADRATGRLVGTTRFHSIVPEHKRLEIGFTWIALPRQRTGVNTEAKYLMLRHAFDTMNVIRVEFRADAENEPSRRALLRIGAREEGVLRRYRISAHRGIRDLAVYSILDFEWPHVRATLEAKLNKQANPPPQRNAAGHPSSGDSSASDTPPWPGARG